MMKKAEAEQAIRHLAIEWMHETDYRPKVGSYPSFSSFRTWLEGKHFSHYLNFRSQVGALHEADGWFESAIKSYWRTNRSNG